MSRPLTAERFWDIIKSIKAPKVFEMATIDPNYSSGRPKVIIDGETVAGNKRFPYLSSYTPKANDRVELAKIKGTWVIQGKIL